jgi:hypothetical protein
MSLNQPIEATVQQIQQLDRAACIHELIHFSHIPLDFTPEFLDRMSVERLRHVLLAAVLTVSNRCRTA